MPVWEPKDDLISQQLAEEEARLRMKRAQQVDKLLFNRFSRPVWQPPENIAPSIDTYTPETEQLPQIEIPQTERQFIPDLRSQFEIPSEPEYALSEPVRTPVPEKGTMIPQTEPIREPVRLEQAKEQVIPELPLWAKTLNIIGLPFKLVQDYLFNPILAGIHQPFTRKLSPQEQQQANKESIRSYFPGGVRYQAYKDLQYVGKWAVEMLPWLIVPPIGTVGVVGGAGARGIAGALSKLGASGKLAGRFLEYSPAGITEKAIGGVLGAMGKGAKKILPAVPPKVVPDTISDMSGFMFSGSAFKEAQSNWFSGSIDKALDFAKARLKSGRGGEPVIRIYRISDIEKRGANKLIDLMETSGKQIPSSEYSMMYLKNIKPTYTLKLTRGFKTTKEDIINQIPQALAISKSAESLLEIAGRGKNITQEITSRDPIVLKAVAAIQDVQAQIPKQKLLTHQLRQEQWQNAFTELAEGKGLESIDKARKAMWGVGEKVQIPGIIDRLSIEDIDYMSEAIKKHFGKNVFKTVNAGEALKVIIKGGDMPEASKIGYLAEVFPDLANTFARAEQNSALYAISEVGNMFRTALASGDVSFPLRQGAVLLSRRPQLIPGVMKRMFKSLYSDKNAEALDGVIRNRKWTAVADQLVGDGHKLELTALPSQYSKLPVALREESFASKWIQNVPILGDIVKASTRAYVTAANDLRSLSWEATVNAWQKFAPTALDYSELAKLINVATGRGSLPKALRGYSNLLNATLFSPKLLWSRIQLPGMIMSPSSLVRKEAARTLVQFMGAGTALVSLAAVASGNKVNWNPLSSDFGKIKVGDTRLDIWTGYAQWARFLAQLTTATRMTPSGNLKDVNRAEVIQRFAQSKGSPLASLLYDIFRGETYTGEEVSLDTESLKRQAWTRIMPLFAQDLIDAIDQEGLVIGSVAGIPSAFGAGVVTYLSPANKMRNELSQQQYGVSFEELGKTQGRAAQMALERSSPQLLALIEQENEFYSKTITGKADINNIYRSEITNIERLYRTVVNQATQEFRDTGDGYKFKERILDAASNRRSQYELLNTQPEFANIVAKQNELPTANELKRMSPQDWARKEYMRLLYGKDMYDQYGNYRFDVVDDMKTLFIQTFGQEMLDYVETYLEIKESDLPQEYQEWRKAQKVLKPYWGVADKIANIFGEQFAESSRGQALIQKERQRMRLINSEVGFYYDMFYKQAS